MKKLINSIVALVTLCSCATAADFIIPNDKVKFGAPNASNNKILEANKGSGSGNPKIRFNVSTSKWQVSVDGTTFFDIAPSATGLFGRIIGSSTQVSNGLATDSTFASAISGASAGDSILVLAGTTYTENVSVNKKLYFIGSGEGAVVNGTWTWASGSSYSGLSGIKLTDNMTFNSGTDGIQVWSIWFSSGKTFIDNTTTTDNYYQAWQE